MLCVSAQGEGSWYFPPLRAIIASSIQAVTGSDRRRLIVTSCATRWTKWAYIMNVHTIWLLSPVPGSSAHTAELHPPLGPTSAALFWAGRVEHSSARSVRYLAEANLGSPALPPPPLPPHHVTPWTFVSISAVCLRQRSLRLHLGCCRQLHLQGHH